MHKPRLITPECEGWHLVEMSLHANRPDWTAAQQKSVHALLAEWEGYMRGRVDSHLITRRSLHLLVRLGETPPLTDDEVLARIQSLAHHLTARKAQLALARGADSPEWQRHRRFWHEESGDISHALKWLGGNLKTRLYGHSPGAIWKDRAYSHPVEPATPVLAGVRLYLAALSARHGHNPGNSLSGFPSDAVPPPSMAVRVLAARLLPGRRPPGLFGRFSDRKVKRKLRRQTRSNAPERAFHRAMEKNLNRFLRFRARHGHDRVWESPAHADLLPWLRKMNYLNRRDRIRPRHREALIQAGYEFPSFRHVHTRARGSSDSGGNIRPKIRKK